MVDWTITMHGPLADAEVSELVDNMSYHGITDCTVTESRRIVRAETEREEEAVLWVTQWLAESLFEVTTIAQIKEERIYWPEFTEEQHYEVDLF